MGTVTKRALMLAAVLSMMLTVIMVAPATSDAQQGSDQFFGTDAKCIASDTVQGDPAAATMGVGNVYEGTDGSRHLITTGGPACSFNCAHGFDINCDGIRGDFCDAGLDLSRVSDVGICLASMGMEAPASVPASAPAAAKVGTETVSVGELAHTGNESAALAIAGAGLLSAGAFALGVRREVRD